MEKQGTNKVDTVSSGPTQQPEIAEFVYDDEKFQVTADMIRVFQQDGVFILRNLFDKQEVGKIVQALEGNPILERAWELDDGEGRGCRMLLWKHPGNDITGMVARCEKMVTTSEQLLGGEVYHYHTKLMMKEARFGGKHHWHQDYGYWYNNGILKPDLLTVFMPLDKCTKENGCLQVLQGSHRCGRIQHNLIHGQTMANQERVDWISQQAEFPLIYGEINPGDALFLHCNVLHRSNRNDSDMRRWAFLVCYNRADNDPMFQHHCASYTPLEKVKNDAVKKCTTSADFTDKGVIDPASDATVKLKKKGAD